MHGHVFERLAGARTVVYMYRALPCSISIFQRAWWRNATYPGPRAASKLACTACTTGQMCGVGRISDIHGVFWGVWAWVVAVQALEGMLRTVEDDAVRHLV